MTVDSVPGAQWAREVEQAEGPVRAGRGEQPVLIHDVGLFRRQKLGRGAARLGEDVPGGFVQQRADEPHRAGRMRTAAALHDRGVAGDDLDALERHVEQIGRDLREHGLVALAARLRAGDEFNFAAAVRMALHGQRDALVGRADRRFDVVRQSDAAQQRPARLLSLRRSRKPFQSACSSVVFHVAAEIAAVIGEPHGGAVGELVLADEIAAADLDAVDFQLLGREFKQPLHHEHRLRAGRRRGTGRSASSW